MMKLVTIIVIILMLAGCTGKPTTPTVQKTKPVAPQVKPMTKLDSLKKLINSQK